MNVPCAYYACSGRRAHHESPDVMRNHQTVDVPDGFDFMIHRAYCSLECMGYDGHPVARMLKGSERSLFQQRMAYVDIRNMI